MQQQTRFTISNIRLYRTKAVIAIFDVRLADVILHDCKYLRPQIGGREIVVGPSSRDRFEPTGWRSHATLAPDFAAEILAEVKLQLAGGQDPNGAL